MEDKVNVEELIERFKKFERQSYDKFKDLFEQIKLDRINEDFV